MESSLPAGSSARGLSGWSRQERAALAIGLVVAIAVRLPLLPMDGLRGDIDQFVMWVHGIANGGLSNAYDRDLSFPPVMTYIFGGLAALDPAFKTVTDGSDPWVRVVMKLPATLADFGLALVAVYALRGHPRFAVAAALAIVLHPAVIDVSAWWGQFESIYILFGAVALVLASEGHPTSAAVALGVAIMTKPQALPFIVPFAAWFLARGGLRGALLAVAAGVATVAVLWLPFLSAGGPARYLDNLAHYQGDVYNVLSLRAWNFWWLIQQPLGGGAFVADGTAILGPISARFLGYGLAAAGELAVFVAVWRRPSPEQLTLGLAGASLVALTFLTTMHERYAYGALIALAFLLSATSARLLWAGLGIALTLNLLAAAPPSGEIRSLIPIDGLLGVAGSIAMVGLTLAALWLLTRAGPRE